MALVVPDQGEIIALKALLNHTAPQDLILRLYVTNVTPSEADTESTYTEATGGGYIAYNLAGGSWSVASVAGVTTATYAQQIFTFTGPLTTNPTIYGYVVEQSSSGLLVWAERAPNPFTPTTTGDTYRVTLNITAE